MFGTLMFGIKFLKCEISYLRYIPLSQVFDSSIQLMLYM